MNNRIAIDTIQSIKKRPDFFRVKAPTSKEYYDLLKVRQGLTLHTVCEEAACPNIAECWSKKHATFMIMGSICTRSCRFCNIKNGKPLALDKNEPKNVAIAVQTLGLKHVVITSVDRDDLDDGGANHFAEVIYEIRNLCKDITIEILTPDFLKKDIAIDIIVNAKPDVFNHNIETVKRLYKKIKLGASWDWSLNLLKRIKEKNNNIFTKSGIIVGMGESNDEIFETMDVLREVNVDFITLGQYLKPNDKNRRYIDVDRFASLEEFELFKKIAYEKGFSMVSSGPLVRSSYHADEDFASLRKNKENI